MKIYSSTSQWLSILMLMCDGYKVTGELTRKQIKPKVRALPRRITDIEERTGIRAHRYKKADHSGSFQMAYWLDEKQIKTAKKWISENA